MRRVLCALAVLALLLAGCTKQQPATPPTPAPSPSPSPTPEPVFAPLTGEEIAEPLERPVLAVKIDNASAALPPAGLEQADIVMEEEVEGGLTRFLALFHSSDPEELGPIRSGRESDADLLPQFQPVLAFSGAANPVKRMLSAAGVLYFEEGEADDAFFRVSDRVAPHNLFARTEPLWAAGEDLPVPDEPVFTFEEDVPDDGEPAAEVHMVFSPFANATWTWSDEISQWEREQNGSAHATAQGETITADNIVVMRVEKSQGARRDSAGNPTVELEVTGRGRAVVLRDGESFRVRWRKPSPEDPLQLLDSEGDAFPLQPGRTWIEVLPTDARLDLTEPADDDATEDPQEADTDED